MINELKQEYLLLLSEKECLEWLLTNNKKR